MQSHCHDWTTRRTNRISNLCRSKSYSLLQIVQTTLGPTHSPVRWALGGVMLTNHVYLSAVVKKGRSYTRTHILCLNGLDRSNFAFFFL